MNRTNLESEIKNGEELRFDIEEQGEYYVSDISISIISIKSKTDSKTTLIIEDCEFDHIRLKGIDSVRIEDTTLNNFEKDVTVHFSSIGSLNIKHSKIISKGNKRTSAGSEIFCCGEVTFEDVEFRGDFKICMHVIESDLILEDSFFSNCKYVIIPEFSTSLRLYNLEFENVKENVIKNVFQSYSIEEVENCPRILLDEL